MVILVFLTLDPLIYQPYSSWKMFSLEKNLLHNYLFTTRQESSNLSSKKCFTLKKFCFLSLIYTLMKSKVPQNSSSKIWLRPWCSVLMRITSIIYLQYHYIRCRPEIPNSWRDSWSLRQIRDSWSLRQLRYSSLYILKVFC